MQDISGPVTQVLTGFLGSMRGSGNTITIDVTGYYLEVMCIICSIKRGQLLDSLTLEGIGQMLTSNTGTVDFCVNNKTQWIGHYYVVGAGGIVYGNYGTTSNCINNGDIFSSDCIGGIAGYNEGQIINCINTGSITASNSGNGNRNGIGGIVGGMGNGHGIPTTGCINIGKIIGQINVGGIQGRSNYGAYGNSTILNCINYGHVKGINKVGGIVGRR